MVHDTRMYTNHMNVIIKLQLRYSHFGGILLRRRHACSQKIPQRGLTRLTRCFGGHLLMKDHLIAHTWVYNLYY